MYLTVTKNGFNQAIELASESLQNVKFIQEIELICGYRNKMSRLEEHEPHE